MKIAEQLVHLGRLHPFDTATAAGRAEQLLDSAGSRLNKGPVLHRHAKLGLGQAWRARGSRG